MGKICLCLYQKHSRIKNLIACTILKPKLGSRMWNIALSKLSLITEGAAGKVFKPFLRLISKPRINFRFYEEKYTTFLNCNKFGMLKNVINFIYVL
jgi:hypothetical protein